MDPSNRLLLQRVPLPQVPGEYSAEVSGEGCVYLQVRAMEADAVPGGEPLPGRSQGEDRKDKGEGRSVGEGSGRGEKCWCAGEGEREGQSCV